MDGNMDNRKDIYHKLRELRRSRGLTVYKLADKMGENHQKVSRIERGKRSLTIDYLAKVSKALETPMELLLEEERKEEPQNDKTISPLSDILNNLVVLVEEYCANCPELNAHHKAKMISKIYELTLKFPTETQMLFLTSLFESLRFMDELD